MDRYTLIRSRRRTMALEVRPDGMLVVRAGHRTAVRAIEDFIGRSAAWIERTTRRVRERYERIAVPELSSSEIRDHRVRVLGTLNERCRYYSERMGVRYGELTLSDARARWGSCSAAGRLRFNWRLALVPPGILDYVVVHELAHRVELNHSPRFWRVVESQVPDVRGARRWLREHAALLEA